MIRKSPLSTLVLYILGPLPLIAVNYTTDPTYYSGYGLIPLAAGATAYTWLILALILGLKRKGIDASPTRQTRWFHTLIGAGAALLVLAHKLFLDNVFQPDVRTLLGNIALVIIAAVTVFVVVLLLRKSKPSFDKGFGASAALYSVIFLTAIVAFIHVMLSHSARVPFAAALYILYFAAGALAFIIRAPRLAKKKPENASDSPAEVAPSVSPVRRFTALLCPIFAAAVVLCSAAILVKTVSIINKINTQMAFNPPPAQTTGTDIIHSDLALDRALVVVTFDDSNESDYAVAYPILKKYGIPGTSFINPYYPDNRVQNRLSWNEIKQMAADGWEIGDHTYTHIALGGATEDQIKKSMEQVNLSFLRNGLEIPETIAYPYGNVSQGVIDVIRHYRKQGRLAAVADELVDLRNIDPYQIQCVSADMQTVNALKSKELIVDRACEAKTVIVLRSHCMYRNTLNDMGKQPDQTNAMLFEQLIRYCVNKGCEFTTMEGLLERYAQ